MYIQNDDAKIIIKIILRAEEFPNIDVFNILREFNRNLYGKCKKSRFFRIFKFFGNSSPHREKLIYNEIFAPYIIRLNLFS